MNGQAQSLDIRHLISEQVAEVFNTMLSLQLVPLPNQPMPHFGERLTGSVGFGGESVAGAVYLHMSTGLAKHLASAMLGLSPEELSENESNDVVGEIANMLTGQLKSCLCDAGVSCAVSTPTIIRGASYEIEHMPEVRRELLLFKCAASVMAVEIHIKFN
jgi:chemotaxis protein CheX